MDSTAGMDLGKPVMEPELSAPEVDASAMEMPKEMVKFKTINIL